ncbi:MAG TPA: 5'-nucleotidase, lipoprotein e(P4) family [Flavobacteriales bacterium]|nr:5'-nucleotidase, lipoprotein e(P4) family [Flavobacteriales bacterium]
MKNAWILFSIAFAGCVGVRYNAGPTVDHAAQLSQQGADATLWQNTSAEAYWLYQQGYDHASLKLETALKDIDEEKQMVDSAKWDRRPTAVIVDIDETVLDNSPYQVHAIAKGRTFDQNEWKNWTDSASAKACPGALDFLKFAQSSGCEVFYITNRDIREKASTLKNLNDIGFPFADDAHLLLMEGTSDKTERRARVAASHHVVLLVGDQLRDFDERFKDRSINDGKGVVDAMSDSLSQYFILLPNPMYGTYRDVIQGKGTDAERHARMKAWFEQNGY